MANKVIENKGMVEIIEIEVDGVKFIQTRPGYYYKRQDGKQTRISKADWEQAFDQYMANKQDMADADEWESEANAEREAREAKASNSDKQAEDAVNHKTASNKESKPRKARKSKDIAFEMNGVTLTAKQVDFIKRLPESNFYEEGIKSILWVDCLADDLSGQFAHKPMTIGAMVSTLREKHIIYVDKDTSRAGNPKFMAFTEFGEQVAKELGLA